MILQGGPCSSQVHGDGEWDGAGQGLGEGTGELVYPRDGQRSDLLIPVSK